MVSLLSELLMIPEVALFAPSFCLVVRSLPMHHDEEMSFSASRGRKLFFKFFLIMLYCVFTGKPCIAHYYSAIFAWCNYPSEAGRAAPTSYPISHLSFYYFIIVIIFLFFFLKKKISSLIV